MGRKRLMGSFVVSLYRTAVPFVPSEHISLRGHKGHLSDLQTSSALLLLLLMMMICILHSFLALI